MGQDIETSAVCIAVLWFGLDDFQIPVFHQAVSVIGYATSFNQNQQLSKFKKLKIQIYMRHFISLILALIGLATITNGQQQSFKTPQEQIIDLEKSFAAGDHYCQFRIRK